MADPPSARRLARGTGYVLSAVVNLILMWVVNQLLDWGRPGFLTDEFADVLPLINLSFSAAIVVNLVWIWRDPAWLKHSAQIGANLVSLAASIRTWQVFPFDFSANAVDWTPAVRGLILLALVGVVVATLSESIRLVRVLDGTSTK